MIVLATGCLAVHDPEETHIPGTRERIVDSSAQLFRTQGYSATGIKQIVTAASAPFGSLYHFFPGGKEELGAEAVRVSGALYAQLIPAVFDPAPDVVTAVRSFFAHAVERLSETDYEDGCPIATVSLEISNSSETMRLACAEVFEGWIAAGAERFESAGITPAEARELAIGMFAALEGASVLARALRTTEPLRVAGELTAQRVGVALARPADDLPTPTAGRVRPRLRARWPDRGAGQSPAPASP